MCVDVDAGGADSFVRLASGVEREWLPPERITTRIEVTFDEKSERLAARKVTRFDDLTLDETNAHIADENEAAAVLASAAAERLEQVLPPPDSAAGEFRTRVRCLRAWVPELNLPAFEAKDLREALESLCRNRRRSLTDVRNGPWLDFLKGQFSYEQLRTIENEAPGANRGAEREPHQDRVRRGSAARPRARIQEMFGLMETPRIARGRVKVFPYLLAPNYRPQQVTDDPRELLEERLPARAEGITSRDIRSTVGPKTHSRPKRRPRPAAAEAR